MTLQDWDAEEFIRESCLIDKQYDSHGDIVPGAAPGDPMYDRHLEAIEVAYQLLRTATACVMPGSPPAVPVGFALDVHRTLTRGLDVFERENASGRYRKHDVSIVRRVQGVKVNVATLAQEPYVVEAERIATAPVGQVVWLMQHRWVPEVGRKLAEDQDPNESAFWCHDFFECIHPFIDGNGRSGRAIYAAMCLIRGVCPEVILYADREKYYEKINAWRLEHYPKFLVVNED